MKTKSLFFAMLVMMSTVAFAFGNDGPGMTVVAVKGSEVFKVIYKGLNAGKVKLNVFDAEGKMIHSENLRGMGNGFICPLNFKGLHSGEYTIEVLDEEGGYRETVFYKPSHELKSIHVSKLRSADGKFLFAVANAQNELIGIRIYDNAERLVYQETKVIKGDFARIYKVENAYSRYTFEVSDAAGNRKFFRF